MDHLRHVRFILAPLVFLGGILFAGVEAGAITRETLKAFDGPQLGAIAGLVVASLIPLGFIFGAVTQMLFTGLFYGIRRDRFDASFSDDDWTTIWKASGAEKAGLRKTDSSKFYAVVVFELEDAERDKGIVGWIERRWNACHASLNGALAVLASAVVCMLLEIPLGTYWLWLFPSFVAICAIQAYVTWHDVMGVIAFRARLKVMSGA